MENKKAISRYIIPVVIFFFLSIAYFVPGILEGKRLSQHDIIQFKGMSKEIVDHRAKYHEEPLWTNSMYGGMPAYLVSTQYKSNLLKTVHKIFTLFDFRPVCFIFLYLIGAYIAFLCFGVSPWLSFAGAIAYAFSSYFFIIIQAGHVSKVLALGYMPPIIAGTYLAFKGKAALGSLIMGIFLGLQISVNHIQITYYTMLIVLVLLVFVVINTIREKTYKLILKPVLWLILFGLLAIGSNFSNLYTTYEYGKYSIRGKSELSANEENKTTGLDKDYATQWSYGVAETFTLLIPDFMGGSSTGTLKNTSHTYESVKMLYGPSEAKKFVASVPLYWGDQPGTSGPVYIGAVIVFLFVFGLFVVKGPVKWWLLAVTIVSILLSWGRNFPAFTNFMLDYFPGYNKFRSVSMTLVMAEFAMPVLAIFAVAAIISGSIAKESFLKALKYTFFGLGGLTLLILLISGSFNVSAPIDEQYRAQGLDNIVDAIQLDRIAILRSDAFRSLIFLSLTAALIYFTFNKKIKLNTFIILLSVLVLVDLWPVDKRYLNSRDFVNKRMDETPFTASTADRLILSDKEPDFKVLNLTVSPLQDASTSWFHKSLGGYHGAKMRRYQELYEHHIQNEIEALYNTMKRSPVPESIDSTMALLNAINMLNTRYIIYNPDAPPLVNKHELGNAWFVSDLKMVKNADEEIAAISTFKPGEQALVDQRFAPMVKGLSLVKDSTANISLTEYRANYLKYAASVSSEQLAVFSEIYYDKGWQAYIDGKPAPHFRVDYVLRSMRVPAGNHTIEFKFHPKSYFLGEKISFASSLILILLVIGTGFWEWKKSRTVEK